MKEDKNKMIEEDLKYFLYERKIKICFEKIINLIIVLLKSKEISRFSDENLKIYIDKNKNNIKNTEHLNIVLVGPSGVGKSTLINAILELEGKTVEDLGKPTTMDIGFYESQK